MRKFVIPAILISAVAVSAPASAQYKPYQARQQSQAIERQLDQVEQRIDRARDRRAISANEARSLSRQAEQIDRLHDRYRRNGLTQWETRDLQNRIQNLRQRIQIERRDGRNYRR